MNKHIITTLAVIAISVPALAGAQAAVARPTRVSPTTTAAPAPQTAGLPEKIIHDRVSNVITALSRHEQLLESAITKVADQSAKFKGMGGDVSAADVDIAAAKVQLGTVKQDIADLQNMLQNSNLKDKTKTQAIRESVAKTIDAIRTCRTTIVAGIQKLKAVTVVREATPTPAPKP
jgi:hypothetical protein